VGKKDVKPSIIMRFAPSRESSLGKYLRGEIEPSEIIENGKRVFPKIKDVEINPNCSDVVFRLPGIPRDHVIAKLKEIGIIEVSENPDSKYPFLADRDNLMVPNIESKFGCAMLDIDEWNDGEIVIHGGINLEYSAFPTLKKIQDAFDGHKWEEMIGGGTTGAFEAWLENGMVFTSRQKKAIKYDRKKPGKETKKFREKFVDPVFSTTLNPNCSEMVMNVVGMTREGAIEKLKSIGITETSIPLSKWWEKKDINGSYEMLVDVDNANLPDWKGHDVITLSGPRTEKQSVTLIRNIIKIFSKTNDMMLDKTTGEIMRDAMLAFRKHDQEKSIVLFTSKYGMTEDETWKKFYSFIPQKNKWFSSSLISLFSINLRYVMHDELQSSKFIMDAGQAIIDGKTFDEIVDILEKGYPEITRPGCYFMTSADAGFNLFPTMLKIENLFGNEWHGHDGGGSWRYEDWRDGVKDDDE
jgi:hypothetical protein